MLYSRPDAPKESSEDDREPGPDAQHKHQRAP